jgi:signal transduction histidine kinase
MLHAADATAEAIDELRTLLREIAPPDLQQIGLAAALDDLADPLREAGIEVTIEVDESVGDVRGTALSATYRITQEALHNVDQHAHARHVRVAVVKDDGRLDLRIVDDGVGFTADRRHRQLEAGHLGLSLIHDLAREAGGDLEVRSVPDAGTTLHARLPTDEEGGPAGLEPTASHP